MIAGGLRNQTDSQGLQQAKQTHTLKGVLDA